MPDAPPLDVSVLGPIAVRDALGADVTPTGTLQRRLLALFVLRRGNVVSSDAAIDVLWPDAPPRDPVASLQNHLFRLRRELPATLMRNIARQAGVHIWVDSDDALYADGGYVGLHAATAGEKTITLPADCTAVDMITGRSVPVEGREARVQMEFGDTVLLRLTPRGQ